MNTLEENRKGKVILVSAFGRANWLATELVLLGLEVVLLDVTEDLGRWAPEDWEGPIGYFQSGTLLQSQRVRLDEEDHAAEISAGFSIWLKSGPFGMRSKHAGYSLNRRQVSTMTQEYLLRCKDLRPKELAELHKKVRQEPFAENWLGHFAHSLGSTDESESTEALDFGAALPLFAPYFVRRPSRRGAEKSLERCSDLGVRVHSKAKIKDLSYLNTSLLNIEMASVGAGVMGADQFVWMLSSQETQRISERAFETLYLNKCLMPTWCWMRYRFELDQLYAFELMPTKFTLVEDLALPWTHANLQLVQKAETQNRFDIWMRVPAAHRFQKNYMEELAAQVTQIWSSRVPSSRLNLVDYPQEYRLSEAELGPSRFVIFNSRERRTFKRRKLTNVHFDGPEIWDSLDWNGQFANQLRNYQYLKSWKLEFDKLQEKLRQKEIARNAQ